MTFYFPLLTKNPLRSENFTSYSYCSALIVDINPLCAQRLQCDAWFSTETLELLWHQEIFFNASTTVMFLRHFDILNRVTNVLHFSLSQNPHSFKHHSVGFNTFSNFALFCFSFLFFYIWLLTRYYRSKITLLLCIVFFLSIDVNSSAETIVLHYVKRFYQCLNYWLFCSLKKSHCQR